MTTTHPVAPHTMHEASPGAATSTSTVIYICPMHPQIRQSRPGQCPICGMTLEPLLPLVEAEESAELKDFSRRFWSTLPLTLLAPAVAMAARRWPSATAWPGTQDCTTPGGAKLQMQEPLC